MSVDERIVIDVLIQLARCEEDLAVARMHMRRAETRSHDLSELQAEYEEDVDQAQGDEAELARRERTKERELRELEAELQLRREKLSDLSDERQVAALQHEIEHLQQKLSATETEALEMLETLDEGLVGVADATEAHAAQQLLRDRELAELKSKAAQGRAAEAEIADEIERLLHQLPADVGRHVARLRQKHDRSISFVQDGACGGCFVQLPPQQGVVAESGRTLVRCPGCARYIVHRPWL